MKDPTTIEEAANARYGKWGGNPFGRAYDKSMCAKEVWPSDGYWSPHQCNRKPGHGPCGLYCKQHAKMMEGAK